MTTDYQFTHVPLNKTKAKKKYKKPEGDIQADCVKYLTSLGFLVLRTNAGVVKTEAGNYFHGIQEGGADLHCCARGLFLAVETKAPKKGLRANQKEYQANVEAKGGTYLWPHSVAELRKGLCAVYGPSKIAQWEAEAAAQADAKQARRTALMRKMGQIK